MNTTSFGAMPQDPMTQRAIESLLTLIGDVENRLHAVKFNIAQTFPQSVVGHPRPDAMGLVQTPYGPVPAPFAAGLLGQIPGVPLSAGVPFPQASVGTLGPHAAWSLPFLAQGSPLVGNPLVGNPLVGNPLVGNPLVGNPLVGANPYVAGGFQGAGVTAPSGFPFAQAPFAGFRY